MSNRVANKPKRVAVLMTDAFATLGGVQAVNFNIARALGEHPGLEARIFSLYDSDSNAVALKSASAPGGLDGVESRFRGFRGSTIHFLISVCWTFLSWRSDLLFVTHRNLFPLALFWKTVTGRPYVLFGHGIEIWDRQAPLYRAALRGARTVLTNSQFTRKRLCFSNGIPMERTQLIELCVRTCEDSDCEGQVRKEGPHLLLTVGRVARGEQYKGQDTVIRALPKILDAFPATRYAIAGSGNDLPRLRQLARETGVEGQVDFLGQISEPGKSDLYRRATIFIMPSRGEGFGLVFLEAMAYRLPCIAGNLDASREIVRDGVNGFTVDPGDSEAVAAAVLRLLSDPDLRTAMGEAGRQIRDREYSFDAFSNRLCNALLKAADRGRAR
jgi:phosphatidyl-myo-inositol dimannoside synthase